MIGNVVQLKMLSSKIERQIGAYMADGEFDIFCSYAHSDNDDGWVDNFAELLARMYRNLTGQAVRLFRDRQSLATADIWETKIRSALEVSHLLVAVISPSFICSEWCRREWDMFSGREAELRHQKLLAEEQGLIFPVLLYPLDRGQFNDTQQAFSALVHRRQWLDASSRLEGSPIRSDQVRALSEQLIDTMSELQQRRRPALVAIANEASGITIHDPATGLEWAATLSSVEMSFSKARKYVKELKIGDTSGWRLPTRAELEGIIDWSLVVRDDDGSIDPHVSPYPLREPFNAQRSGYLHSGTLIDDKLARGNFIMNVRNGHIFNGKGRDCFVRAVRGIPVIGDGHKSDS